MDVQTCYRRQHGLCSTQANFNFRKRKGDSKELARLASQWQLDVVIDELRVDGEVIREKVVQYLGLGASLKLRNGGSVGEAARKYTTRGQVVS